MGGDFYYHADSAEERKLAAYIYYNIFFVAYLKIETYVCEGKKEEGVVIN